MNTILFPVIELVDRYSIAKLKSQKTGTNQLEIEFYQQQLCKYDLALIEQDLNDLYQIHNQIWNLEAELKSGRDSDLSLEEIGRRALAIRDLNNKRIKLKNIMADKLGCQIKEIKNDHLSE